MAIVVGGVVDQHGHATEVVHRPAAGILQGISPNTVILINSHQSPETWQHRLNLDSQVLILPASEDVEDRAELPFVGATCTGAAACLLGVIERDTLAAAISEELEGLGDEVMQKNLANALAAFDAMAGQHGLVKEGADIVASGYDAPHWIELPFEDATISAPTIHATGNSVEVRTGLWRTMRPVIDYERCNDCWWVCSTFCPDSAINVDNDRPVIDYDHCKGCLVCVGVCPPHAIDTTPEYLAQEAEAQQMPESEGAGQ